jgi:hypothetical protein
MGYLITVSLPSLMTFKQRMDCTLQEIKLQNPLYFLPDQKYYDSKIDSPLGDSSKPHSPVLAKNPLVRD